MTLHLRPETQAKLAEIAAAQGLSASDYLAALVERELQSESLEAVPAESVSGMVVEEKGLPVRPRITGPEGIDVLRQIRDRLTVVTLAENEYTTAIEAVAATIVGGAVYDALIARCAVKAKADVLLTWNQRDFLGLGHEIG